MKKALLTCSILLCLNLSAFAQHALWSRTYGGADSESGRSLQQTTDGGYIVVGETNSFGAGGGDVYLIKINPSGDTLWSRTYGGSYRDVGLSVQQTTDGGYIVVGFTYSFGAGGGDVYLIRTDSNGDTLWSRTYGGSDDDQAWCVQQTTDGGYIVVGETNSFGAGGDDVYLIEIDPNGVTMWNRTYGGSEDDRAYSVQQTTDGGYVVVGETNSFGAGGYDVYLIKTDSDGDTLWTRTYGRTENDRGYSVQQIPEGYIVGGKTHSFGAAGYNVYLLKIAFNGVAFWTRPYGGNGWDGGYSVQRTTDGGYIVAGEANSFGADGYDVYLIKTNSSGDTLWSRTYGEAGDDRAYSVQQTTDGGYMVAGITSSFGVGSHDVMLTKLDSLGNTCIGGFVPSHNVHVSHTITSPTPVITSPPPTVTSPVNTVTSPGTEVATVCMPPCGDVNGDNSIDVGDAIYLIGYLYLAASPPDPSCMGDVNCDSAVDGGDVIYLINYLFTGTSPPCSQCCSTP
jgi:hypothetical protein